MAKKSKEKIKEKIKEKKPFKEGKSQVNIFCEEDIRDSFKLMCSMRGWTNGEGLSALIHFMEDVRDNPKNAAKFVKKYGLNKVSE